jgi:large subunit ribosomal protein L32e
MKKKPKFLRQSSHAYKRLSGEWRRPRGSQSKLRRHKVCKGLRPSASYGSPKAIRYLHPSGFREVLIFNTNDLSKIDASKEAIKIGSSVGKKKRQEILKKAEEMKIKVLNP